MISDCSSRFSSDWRSDRIPIVTLSKSISSAAFGAWAGGSLCGRARWACGCVIMWLCLAPVAPAARGPHVGSSYVPTHRGGRGEDGGRRGTRMRAPPLRRQVCTAESCYRSPVKVVRGGNVLGKSVKLDLGAPAASPGCRPGWPGAAGLTRRILPATRFSDLKINNLRRKEQCRLGAADCSSLTDTVCCITVSLQ